MVDLLRPPIAAQELLQLWQALEEVEAQPVLSLHQNRPVDTPYISRTLQESSSGLKRRRMAYPVQRLGMLLDIVFGGVWTRNQNRPKTQDKQSSALEIKRPSGAKRGDGGEGGGAGGLGSWVEEQAQCHASLCTSTITALQESKPAGMLPATQTARKDRVAEIRVEGQSKEQLHVALLLVVRASRRQVGWVCCIMAYAHVQPTFVANQKTLSGISAPKSDACVAARSTMDSNSCMEHHTMRFGSTAKVLAECKLKYCRFSECTSHNSHLHWLPADHRTCRALQGHLEQSIAEVISQTILLLC